MSEGELIICAARGFLLAYVIVMLGKASLRSFRLNFNNQHRPLHVFWTCGLIATWLLSLYILFATPGAQALLNDMIY